MQQCKVAYGASMPRDIEGTNVVLLEPAVVEAFPNDEAVNQALRGVLNTPRAVRGTGELADKSLQPAS